MSLGRQLTGGFPKLKDWPCETQLRGTHSWVGWDHCSAHSADKVWVLNQVLRLAVAGWRTEPCTTTLAFQVSSLNGTIPLPHTSFCLPSHFFTLTLGVNLSSQRTLLCDAKGLSQLKPMSMQSHSSWCHKPWDIITQ